VTTAPDLCFDLASHVSGTNYESLSPDAIDIAKKSILDSLGVILAASGMEPAVRAVVDLVKESGGRPEASILAFGGRAPAIMAALANGAMAHCLDYDDQTPWGQHSGSSLLPAVFAAAERRGLVTGKEMIAAVAVGQDIFNRIRRHVDWRKDFMFTTVVGVFSATAGAGSVLKLPRQQIAHALGIASMQSCGTMNMIHAVGSNLRALYAGFPAKGAILSTLLAEKGVTGLPELFEGEHGVFDLYFHGKYDREALLKDLGTEYTGEQTLFKRWPTVGTAHSHIHATIGIVKQHDLSVDDITEIRVYVGDYHQLMCDPLVARRAPTTLVDAKFSLPYIVAVAAAHRDVRLADFTAEALKRSDILAVAQRVVPVADASLDWKLTLPPGRVEILTRDGRKFEAVGTDIPGSETSPMTWDDITAKFRDCTDAAVAPPSVAQVHEVEAMARSLETVDDATRLLRLLSPSAV
jgi:2-methylcitrate dehydratase PrpD